MRVMLFGREQKLCTCTISTCNTYCNWAIIIIIIITGLLVTRHYYYYDAIGNPQNHVASTRMQPMTKQVQPYQHLDPPRQLPNVSLVNEARKVKWFAQVHNTLAVAWLKLTTFVLRVLHFSTIPHVPLFHLKFPLPVGTFQLNLPIKLFSNCNLCITKNFYCTPSLLVAHGYLGMAKTIGSSIVMVIWNGKFPLWEISARNQDYHYANHNFVTHCIYQCHL